MAMENTKVETSVTIIFQIQGEQYQDGRKKTCLLITRNTIPHLKEEMKEISFLLVIEPLSRWSVCHSNQKVEPLKPKNGRWTKDQYLGYGGTKLAIDSGAQTPNGD
ncbi:coproporphyrinogen-III oxidase [Striga asiatica]|uniref:Coproporphyrinogen-III oxidase n=1 Tax=Striga asiatica TaxID=4170 RepID=A0A5A7Q950_STRAF|nr:coproporphyrinogen-III oxidase [Striga asiatica]